MVDVKLTIKQQAFADYYIKSGNATQSAVRAGYKKKTAGQTGAENLKKPYIKEYIKQRTNQIKDDRVVDLKRAMELLSNIAERKPIESRSKAVDHLNGEEVIKDTTYTYQPDVDQQTKALEHLVKIQGGFDNNDSDSNINVNIVGFGDDPDE